jgi:hypothetical protein
MLLIGAGILTALGGLLDWGELSDETGGITIQGGSFGIIIGVVLAVAGVIVLLFASKVLRIVLGILALLGGGFLGLIGAAPFVDDSFFARSAAEAILEANGVPQTEENLDATEAGIVEALEAGDIGRSFGPGLFVFLAGGIVALVGGALTIAATRRPEPAPSMPTPAPSMASTPSMPSAGPPPTPPTPPAPAPPPGTPPS